MRLTNVFLSSEKGGLLWRESKIKTKKKSSFSLLEILFLNLFVVFDSREATEEWQQHHHEYHFDRVKRHRVCSQQNQGRQEQAEKTQHLADRHFMLRQSADRATFQRLGLVRRLVLVGRRWAVQSS